MDDGIEEEIRKCSTHQHCSLYLLLSTQHIVLFVDKYEEAEHFM